MTDIWRSFVAQRIAWENDWTVLFHNSTVFQERNEHNLMRDFTDEVPGYLNNGSIGSMLASVKMKSGTKEIPNNMRLAYQTLIEAGLVRQEELNLLDAWLNDIAPFS
jgi:hypothetical protein